MSRSSLSWQMRTSLASPGARSTLHCSAQGPKQNGAAHREFEHRQGASTWKPAWPNANEACASECSPSHKENALRLLRCTAASHVNLFTCDAKIIVHTHAQQVASNQARHADGFLEALVGVGVSLAQMMGSLIAFGWVEGTIGLWKWGTHSPSQDSLLRICKMPLGQAGLGDQPRPLSQRHLAIHLRLATFLLQSCQSLYAMKSNHTLPLLLHVFRFGHCRLPCLPDRLCPGASTSSFASSEVNSLLAICCDNDQCLFLVLLYLVFNPNKEQLSLILPLQRDLEDASSKSGHSCSVDTKPRPHFTKQSCMLCLHALGLLWFRCVD